MSTQNRLNREFHESQMTEITKKKRENDKNNILETFKK